MPILKLPQDVDEPAIAACLAAHIHARLHGKEFSVGQLVRFKWSKGDGPCEGQLGVIAEATPEQDGYRVAYVNAAGDVALWRTRPFNLTPEFEKDL